MRRGFTLIEVMVASLLLGMLVVILTMIFNQSSIAWRTGVGGADELAHTRAALAIFEDVRDNVLPGLWQANVKVTSGSDNRTVNWRTVSLWDEDTCEIRPKGSRAVEVPKWSVGTATAPSFTANDAVKASALSLPSGGGGGAGTTYSVGVRSWGPDGIPDTPDDISTWPEEID